MLEDHGNEIKQNFEPSLYSDHVITFFVTCIYQLCFETKRSGELFLLWVEICNLFRFVAGVKQT